jgi:hypothetical protein
MQMVYNAVVILQIRVVRFWYKKLSVFDTLINCIDCGRKLQKCHVPKLYV